MAKKDYEPIDTTGYKCSSCEELHECEDDALWCCSEDKMEEVEAWECAVCGKIHGDKDEAFNCCYDGEDDPE